MTRESSQPTFDMLIEQGVIPSCIDCGVYSLSAIILGLCWIIAVPSLAWLGYLLFRLRAGPEERRQACRKKMKIAIAAAALGALPILLHTVYFGFFFDPDTSGRAIDVSELVKIDPPVSE